MGEIHENFIARYNGNPSRPVGVVDWNENSPREERPIKDRSPAPPYIIINHFDFLHKIVFFLIVFRSHSPPSRVAEARRDVRPAVNPSARANRKTPENNKGKGKENNGVSSK